MQTGTKPRRIATHRLSVLSLLALGADSDRHQAEPSNATRTGHERSCSQPAPSASCRSSCRATGLAHLLPDVKTAMMSPRRFGQATQARLRTVTSHYVEQRNFLDLHIVANPQPKSQSMTVRAAIAIKGAERLADYQRTTKCCRSAVFHGPRSR